MTKKELEKELEIKKEELKIHIDYEEIMENVTAFSFTEILKLSVEFSEDAEITVKIKAVLSEFIKKQKGIKDFKEKLMKELKDSDK